MDTAKRVIRGFMNPYGDSNYIHPAPLEQFMV